MYGALNKIKHAAFNDNFNQKGATINEKNFYHEKLVNLQHLSNVFSTNNYLLAMAQKMILRLKMVSYITFYNRNYIIIHIAQEQLEI